MQSLTLNSFDVFDTVISRCYAVPEDLHWHLGEILAEWKLVKDADSFFCARQDSERVAWQQGHYRVGISIFQIYEIVADKLRWTEDEMRRALAEEVRLETKTAQPVPDILAALNKARKSGQKVCFISDMHLVGNHIKAILLGLDILRPDEIVFVSSDIGVTKRSGRLFNHVLEQFRVKPQNMHHTGDHLLSDFRVARKKGISAHIYSRAQLNHHEASILNQVKLPNWRLRSLATISKFSRLAHLENGQSNLRDLLSSTIAPFVSGYAIWLITRASTFGIKKLFFLARDMQIVHEVASNLAKSRNLDLQCIYIYASRKAWQTPAYAGANDFEISWLQDHLAKENMESILRRLLSKDDLQKIKAIKGVINLEEDSRDKDRLIQLLQSEPVSKLIKESTSKKRKTLLGYLRQKGFYPDKTCALVDAGWRGTLQKCLARTYKNENISPKITGFYIGLSKQISHEECCDYQAFLPYEIPQKYGYSLCALLESFLTANHGTTLDYQQTLNGFEPVLAPLSSNVLLEQWHLVRDCCVSYADLLQNSTAFHCDTENLTNTLTHPFMNLCAQPIRQDAKLLSNWIYDAGRDHPKLLKTAASLDFRNILKLLVYKIRKTRLANTYLSGPWLQGNIQVSSPILRLTAKLLVPKD